MLLHFFVHNKVVLYEEARLGHQVDSDSNLVNLVPDTFVHFLDRPTAVDDLLDFERIAVLKLEELATFMLDASQLAQDLCPELVLDEPLDVSFGEGAIVLVDVGDEDPLKVLDYLDH